MATTSETNIKDTLKRVSISTALLAGVGSAAGGTLGLIRNESVALYAKNMGMNFGIFGLLFFGTRESLLRGQRQQNSSAGLLNSQVRDFDELYCSALAGATTGGLLAGLARGRKSIISGVLAYGLICGTGQFLYTKMYRLRQHLILQSLENERNGQPKRGFFEYVWSGEWSPVRMRRLSHEEAAKIRKEKELLLEESKESSSASS
ncbi:11196_t:CDS:2 [Ambispora leptoticha]|uniref:11196_t:CDS:1 n=1 Tax=Ambispora leptoticha TaxID=144679 RepID=A0A9N8WLE6_9GLOM|nr:11196_t:CDS:2 [Ambispora leptoticha]